MIFCIKKKTFPETIACILYHIFILNVINLVHTSKIEDNNQAIDKNYNVFLRGETLGPHQPNGLEVVVTTKFINKKSNSSSIFTNSSSSSSSDVRFPHSNPNTYALTSTVGHQPKDIKPKRPSDAIYIYPPEEDLGNNDYNEPEDGDSNKSEKQYSGETQQHSSTYVAPGGHQGPNSVFEDVIHTVGSFFRAIQTFPNFVYGTGDGKHLRPQPEMYPAQEENVKYTPSFYSNGGDLDSSMEDAVKHTTDSSYPPNSFPPQPSYQQGHSDKEWNPTWSTLGDLNRHQCTYERDVEFPCGHKSQSSFYSPESSHYLRPGDLQIVAALGDGIIAGKGAMADNLADMTIEYKGVSFATGGDTDWRKKLTIPNILKEFNSRLKGASKGYNEDYSGRNGFNYAKSNAVSSDLREQADKLISKLKRSTSIEVEEDWKLITILVGQNDLCQLTCKHNSSSHEKNSRVQTGKKFSRNVRRAIDKLYKSLPKTVVNIVLPSDPRYILELFNRPLVCHLSSKVLCPCMDGPDRIGKEEMKEFVESYRDELIELAMDDRYQDYDDFTVLVQPGLEDLSIPRKFANLFGIYKTFLPDLSYLAPDCFHPSQKLHALFAKKIWNNLLEPVGGKSGWALHNSDNLRCPTRSDPFIGTYLNSQDDFELDEEEIDEEEEDDEEDYDKPFERLQLKRRKRKRRRNKRIRDKRSESLLYHYKYNTRSECSLL